MARQTKKVPSSAAGEKSSKKPAIDPSYRSPHTYPPVWRIDLLQREDPYGWEAVSPALLWEEILPKLSSFETMTWAAILGKQNHEVSVASLCTKAQKRLKALRLDDIEQLVLLRLGGKKRIWGIKEHRVLRLLWWDPNHKVCPSIKRHT